MVNSELSWLKHLVWHENAGIKRLFEQYYVSLVLFAKAYVRDEEAAKDAVQDVFFALVESREKFTTIDNLKVYLYSAVKNRCLKYIRHEGVKGRYALLPDPLAHFFPQRHFLFHAPQGERERERTLLPLPMPGLNVISKIRDGFQSVHKVDKVLIRFKSNFLPVRIIKTAK